MKTYSIFSYAYYADFKMFWFRLMGYGFHMSWGSYKPTIIRFISVCDFSFRFSILLP